MKVALAQVRPNPFRNIDRYPIDRVKVEALKASISRTSFWDNVVARRAGDGDVEIAYGHHRLVSLRELYPPEHEVDLIVRDLTDADMLHIMADENMQEWTASAPVVVETVRAVRDFLRLAPDKVSAGGRPPENGSAVAVATFLGWPLGRVVDAIRILSAEEEGILEPEDTKDLGIKQAAVMRGHVGRITDPAVRRQAITRVRAGLTSETIGTRGIAETVYDVRRETGYDAARIETPKLPRQVAEDLYRDIEGFWRKGVALPGQGILTRSEVLRLIAANRDAVELRGSVLPWNEQLALALIEMATQAQQLAAILRADEALVLS